MSSFLPMSLLLGHVVFASFTARSDAAAPGFLRGVDRQEYMSLVGEIGDFLGRARTRERVSTLETLFAPMFATLPKNAHGRIERPTVRYALHRFFSKQGLLVNGLDLSASQWNESSPVSLLKDGVPGAIEGMLEERLADEGYGLHELAILATALRHLFMTEATKRLDKAYRLQGITIGESVDDHESLGLLDSYMALYIADGFLGISTSGATLSAELLSYIGQYYPGWEETRVWVHDTRKNLVFAERDITNPFVKRFLDFSDLLRTVEEVHDKYGAFQDAECQDLKDKLLKHEYGASGRVRLADFYGSALQGHWQFTESLEYLRQIGALDESYPEDPRVVVANYLYGLNNCVAKSAYYSVCCINECDSILDHIERRLQVAEVTSRKLADAVAHVPSSSEAAPRNLSHTLLRRLDEVAAMHGGIVPMHGRLFRMLLHHAYPRECPFPHLSGTIDHGVPKEPEDEGMMKLHAKKATWRMPELGVASATTDYELLSEHLPWSDDEELLQQRLVGATGWVRRLAPIFVVVAMLINVWRISGSTSLGDKRCEVKWLV